MELSPNRVLRVEGTVRGRRRENGRLIDMANDVFLEPMQKCVELDPMCPAGGSSAQTFIHVGPGAWSCP